MFLPLQEIFSLDRHCKLGLFLSAASMAPAHQGPEIPKPYCFFFSLNTVLKKKSWEKNTVKDV